MGWFSFFKRETLEQLLDQLRTGSTEDRLSAIDQLKDRGHPQIGEWLVRTLADPDAQVRAHAAGTLGAVGATGASGPLAGLLADNDAWVRCRAAQALGWLGEREAIPALQRALHDQAEEVQTAARIALDQLSLGR